MAASAPMPPPELLPVVSGAKVIWVEYSLGMLNATTMPITGAYASLDYQLPFRPYLLSQFQKVYILFLFLL
jgi:hypothetical protein